MSIETLYKMDQKKAKIDDYVANLKKNPKQVMYNNLNFF